MQQAFEILLSVQVPVALPPSFLAFPFRSACMLAETSIVWPANSNQVWQASKKKLSCCCGEIKHPEQNYGVLIPQHEKL